MINKKAIIYIEALFAVVIWGANFVATKDVVREISPVTIIWLRFGMGFLILGAATAWRKQFALPQKGEWAYLALLGFLGITFHQWLQATGLVTAAATTTAWIVATIPVFTALLGWLVLREKLGWLAIVGIVLAAFGVLLIVSKGNLSALATGDFGTTGDFLVLISAVNWAIFSVLSRRGLASQPAARMMFYVMFFGWLFTSLWLFGFGPGLSEIPQLSTRGWGNILVLGILGSGLAYIAWFDALREIPASRLSAFIYIEPLVTVLVAALWINETISAASLIGGGIVILGVYLVNRR
ncbi:MAG: EamA/RhaT family transporter [Chloroflexi bacterium HGW-Chloroflexi-6]|nr:MAG: EamA/RhaT family transporter [Chloroflexi bacterium HGW-Chloroflexi-6]